MDNAAGPAHRGGQGPPPAARVAADEASTRPGTWWNAPWGVLDSVGVLVVAAVVTAALVFGIGVLAALDLAPEELGPVMMPLPLVVLAVVTVAWVQTRFGSEAVRRLTGPARARIRARSARSPSRTRSRQRAASPTTSPSTATSSGSWPSECAHP